jgi:hypothetical protein
MPRSINSQVPIVKIEYESERPTWENPLAQMRRGIAIAEPEILNEIRETAQASRVDRAPKLDESHS